MFPEEELDFTVYRQRRKKSVVDGRESTSFWEVKTRIVPSNQVCAVITRIPNLKWIRIFDGPYFFNPPLDDLPWCPSVPCLYVHYRDRDETSLGGGNVTIIERKTAKVIYDGSDGMK